MFTIVSPARAQEQPAEETGIYKREYHATDWRQQIPGVDYTTVKSIQLKYGDIIATKEKTIIFEFDGFQLMAMPYSAIRVKGKGIGENATAAPELLFGEALLKGPNATVFLPGQTIECHGTGYAIVDEDKFSMAATVDGDLSIVPEGATQSISLANGNYLELGPSGENGTPDQMTQEDVDLYSRMTFPDNAPKATTVISKEEKQIDPFTEYWNRDRITMLKDGPETPAGLAIASGANRQQEKPKESQQSIQVFDKTKGSQQKSLSFSSTVSVVKKSAEIPKLMSLTVSRKKVSPGDLLPLKFKDLDSKTIPISGKITTNEPDLWTFFIKINGDETKLSNPASFDYAIRAAQDFPALPKVTGVMIGDDAASRYTEETVITREKLTSGKLLITGNAAAGQNVIRFTVLLVARDTDDKEYPLSNFQIELDLSELSRVEVSTDGGRGWEAAKGLSDWTYSFSPMDNETYKVKVRAYDVMDTVSEDQFEPYPFKYRYKTDSELLREVFDNIMRAFLDKDRVTFFRNVSQDFKTNLDGLRDYNDLKTSVEERFRCCTVNIRYTVQQVDAERTTSRGSVDFSWVDRASVSGDNNSAIFNFTLEEGEWRLLEVIDPNTFLRASRIAYSIKLTIQNNVLNADGESSTSIRALVMDSSGSIVADDVSVNFSATSGTLSPQSTGTSQGYADTVFTAPTTSGTATITATSGNISVNDNITLNPVQPPLPPD